LFLKKDNLKLGLLLGLILPVIVFFVIYFIRFSEYPFDRFLNVLKEENRLITFFGTWCMVANIALFTLYVNTNRYQTSKGVFGITLVYGILILLLKVLN
jgi:hypothetical protein